ncbi:MAG: phosphoribosylamine--glycine ligase [Coxiella sp. (in: Bacteria)]|nr:MAG: phosphoribosylamine--glycine ligase [Coxiella sp. (in: g-proteobacteria)]
MPYKLLFVTLDALITDIAWQCSKEGHDVLMYIDNKEEDDIGDGLINKTKDWKQNIDWADVIIFDDVLGQGKVAHELRQQGKAVVGGTEYTDRLEDDRNFGQDEIEKHGIEVIPYEQFSDFDEAIRYVKEHPMAYVIKPSGEAQNIKRLLFVGQEEDGSDVARILASYKDIWADEIDIFQLQQKVIGVEVAVGAFFNGNQFVYPININFENKKLCNGGLGPSTGEMGTSMFWSEPNVLFNATLKKFEATLAKEHYVGYIDINCIVNEKGIFPLEFTSRFGYPSISIQQESMITPFGDFLHDIAHGKITRFKAHKGYQMGARVVVPPYPYRDKRTFDGYSKNAVVVFKDKNNTQGVHIEDVKMVDGRWVVCGSSGTALIVAGMGMTMKEAQQQMYERIENILIPNMYYRTDIGNRWFSEHDALHVWAYLHTTGEVYDDSK